MTEDGEFGSSTAALAGFDAAPDSLIVAEGPDLVITAVNLATRRLIPDTPMLGRPCRDALRDALGLPLTPLIDGFERCYRTGQPQVEPEGALQVNDSDGTSSTGYFDFSLTPLLDAGGRPRGVVGRAADATTRVVAELEAETDGSSVRRQLQAAQEAMVMLQEALLPANLPVLAGLDVAGHYLLATADTAVGGDWFDAVPYDDGQVALVVGDVIGHGVIASAAMGQLRAVAHERLWAGVGAAAAARSVDSYIRDAADISGASLCIVDLNLATGEFSYLTAGHPAPLVVGADGSADYLALTGTSLLGGAYLDGLGDIGHGRLAVGSVLVLYSDGLIERPGLSATENLDGLRDSVSDALTGQRLPSWSSDRAVERVCSHTVDGLVRASGYRDDITILAAQLRTVGPLRITIADTARPADVLHEVLGTTSAWLAALGLRAADEAIVQHAVGELVTNAVRHAYPDERPGPVHVEMAIDNSGVLTVIVSDEGRWQQPRAQGSDETHGLAIVEGIAEWVDVAATERGTTVTAVLRPSHEITVLTQLPGAARRPAAERWGGQVMELIADQSVVRLRGPIDHFDAEWLQSELRRLTAGGSTIAAVDLTEVTYLCSAAINVLQGFASAARGAARGTVLLIAPDGSTAQRLLTVAGVPHVPAL